MNAMRITQLLATLERDYDMDGDLAEQGCDEDSVLLRSGDERTEVVLRFEAEEWEIHFTHDDDEQTVTVKLTGEGFGDDHGCDLTDALDSIETFTGNIGV
jgi:hypothetical protein